MACHLLAPSNDSYHDRTLMQTLMRAATWCAARVRKRRHESVRDLIIPVAAPHNVMPRKCAKYGGRVLDDAFAWYTQGRTHEVYHLVLSSWLRPASLPHGFRWNRLCESCPCKPKPAVQACRASGAGEQADSILGGISAPLHRGRTKGCATRSPYNVQDLPIRDGGRQ